MNAFSSHFKTGASLLLGTAYLLAASIGLQSQAAQVTEATVEKAVVAHVQQQLQNLVSPADKPYISVAIMRVPTNMLDFPEVEKASDIKLTADSPLKDMYSDRSIVRVQMTTPEGESREIGIPIQIVIKKPVWVAKNIVNAGAPLRASDFSLETRDVSHVYGHVAGQEQAFNNYIARVNLRPGEILDTRKIIIPPDVSYNDDVRITLSTGNGMTVTLPGIALGNGRIGENIRVRQTLYQRKTFTAKIIDKNRVLVEI